MNASYDTLKKAVLDYLDFAAEHKELAETIANETARTVLEDLKEARRRESRLTIEQRIALAARAHIRHAYTAYDDVLIENTIEQAQLTMNAVFEETGGESDDDVARFIEQHRKSA